MTSARVNGELLARCGAADCPSIQNDVVAATGVRAA